MGSVDGLFFRTEHGTYNYLGTAGISNSSALEPQYPDPPSTPTMCDPIGPC